MFVVRIENDEATLFRAFRRWQSAKSWAVERNGEDLHSLVDIFDVPGTDDVTAAVAKARNGEAALVQGAEAIATPSGIADLQRVGHAPSDHAFA